MLIGRPEVSDVPQNGQDDSAKYRREKLVERALQAFERPDRKSDVLPLCEREARRLREGDQLIIVLIPKSGAFLRDPAISGSTSRDRPTS